jgi:N-acetylated-alpha-linked acidic dipeptidase
MKPAPPTFLSYSASGDVTAELVYANYGRLQDFEKLVASGISVSGKIVIVRYGKIFRGNKVEIAEKFGARACLIYSDPALDGYVQGPVYPDGPWKPASGVQRGTIWTGNGDPQTPGWPSMDLAPRVPVDELFFPNKTFGTPLSKIPALPLSYGDAEPLLRALGGLSSPSPSPSSICAFLSSSSSKQPLLMPSLGPGVFDSDWQGGLNFTYHIGPGPAQVRVFQEMNLTQAQIWNVIGKITGHVEPDRLVILGNHRDAWTFGGGDPSSGTATMLEVARGLGSLLERGWAPRRTLWLCSWDAEEYALVGSTEFAELHEKELMFSAVAYLNVDISAEGSPVFEAEGIPSLNGLVQSVVSEVPAPEGSPEPARFVKDLWEAGILMAQNMGTGSDYGSFIQHLGIPSVDIRFVSPEAGRFQSVYHSIYDDYRWMKKFGDPNFQFMKGIAQVWGMLAIRLSDALLLPFNFTDYGVQLLGQIPDLKKHATDSGLDLDFTNLETALGTLISAARQIDTTIATLDTNKISPLALRKLNDKLMLAERSFLFLQGFPGREWYRHVVWVTGLYDGYASVAFASIADAITQKNSDSAKFQVSFVSTVVLEVAQHLQGITDI